MNLLINFITAAAWIWGGLNALGLFLMAALAVMGERQKNSSQEAATFCSRGFIAWAWLIARYCL